MQIEKQNGNAAESKLSQDKEIRLEAIRAASRVATASDDISNLLIHAEWLCQFVETGRAPEVESNIVAGSVASVDKV